VNFAEGLHEMVAQIARIVVEPARDSMAERGHPHLGREHRHVIGNASLA
jgi:hypothetical protein